MRGSTRFAEDGVALAAITPHFQFEIVEATLD